MAFVKEKVSDQEEVDISIPEITGSRKVLLKGEWKNVSLIFEDSQENDYGLNITMFLTN